MDPKVAQALKTIQDAITWQESLPLAPKIEADLRAAAADWMETEIGHVSRILEVGRRREGHPLAPKIEADLRAAAADWMETEIGHVYGQTVFDILDGI